MRPMMPLGGRSMGGAPRDIGIMRPQPIGSPMRPSAFPRAFKKGGRVRRGGIAKLHKGERVVTRKQYATAKSVLGAGKRRLIEAAGREMKANPPKILAKTARKSGAARANKQRVAIMLSKARAAGANIPEKG